MLPFVSTKDERTGSVIKQVKRNVLLNSVCLLSDLETDRYNNENKKHHYTDKFYIMLTIHKPFEFFSM